MGSSPLVPFLFGLVAVVVFLVVLRLPAFLGLTLATIVVGLSTPEVSFANVPPEMATAFGDVMEAIGIPILMAAIIGKSLMDSGAAERIVRTFLAQTGDERSEVALLGSSYVLSIPVFVDNVFYLLAPLGRSMYARTGTKYPLYVAVLSAGALATHMLVPPTPGPLAMADTLNVDLGIAMLVGALVALPVSMTAGLVYGRWIDQRLTIPLREAMGSTAEVLEANASTSLNKLPGLGEALLPIALPVALIGTNTVMDAVSSNGSALASATDFLGSPTIALTLAALVAAATFYRTSDLNASAFGEALTDALKSGGNIIAITAAGGAFGALLRTAGVGEYIANALTAAGIPLLITGWLIGGVIRIAQGSGTVAVLTGASMMAPLTPGLDAHPVYMMMAVGTGALLFSWYNDSGFWIVNEVAGLTQEETLKTWSAVNTVMAVTGLLVVLLLSTLLPLA
ncbi:gluconate transporter [Salinibacter sp. 10B]|uniref:GntP family permease n=1 Tax=Salinibacter sp. 10B TaxID=1923971 RepID=UPI000CF57E9F|nr:gluconate transporter [Salinibacter sp. 10B]PQJ33860.1 gluconate transporter [Salinibacter sp. 10B]